MSAWTPASVILQLGNERGSVEIVSIRVYQEYYARLSAAIDSCVDDLARELLSRNLISVEATNEMLRLHGYSHIHKSLILMSIIGYAIAGDSSDKLLKQLCGIMKTHSHLKRLAEDMTQRIEEIQKYLEEERIKKEMVEIIRRGRYLVKYLLNELQSWLQKRDQTIHEVKFLKEKARDIRIKGNKTRNITAAGVLGVTLPLMIFGPIGFATSSVVAASTAIGVAGYGVMAGSGVVQKIVEDHVLRKAQDVINADAVQSKEVDKAFHKLKNFCEKVRQRRDLPFFQIEAKCLYNFFIYCYQCSEEDIPRLVAEAMNMTAKVENVKALYIPIRSMTNFAFYVVDIAILSVNVFGMFGESSTTEEKLNHMFTKLSNEREDLNKLVLTLQNEEYINN